jgi:nicotinamidase-related amidase
MTRSEGQQRASEFFGQRGFGNRIGFGERPCVLVVDLIRGFTDPAMPLGSELGAEIETTNRLLAGARAATAPVFFTSVGYDEDDLAGPGVWANKQTGLTSLRTGTPTVELDPRLERRRGEVLIRKRFASAFFATDLASRLAALRVDTVIVVGCTTSGCVRASAIDALQHGYRPIVVEDAVGDRWPEAHSQSLFDLDQKYCDVMTATETVDALRHRHTVR